MGANHIDNAIYDLLQQGGGYLGNRVFRAATTFPAAIAYNLFTIAGGNIVVISLVGEVTVNCAGVSTVQFASDPTVGAAVPFDDGTVILGGALVGTLIAPTGGAGVAAELGQAVDFMAQPMICKPGVITMTPALATLGVGELEFTLHYIPMEPGVTVT